MTTNELKQAARGMGRYHYRMRLTRDMAVRATLDAHPELAEFEREIRIGWNNERSGR